MPALSGAIAQALQAVENAHLNGASGLRAALGDAQVKMQIGTELLGLSAKAVAAAKTAQAAELRLFMKAGKEEAEATEAVETEAAAEGDDK